MSVQGCRAGLSVAAERVTLFCAIERPLGAPGRWLNAAVQRALGFDRRYRSGPERAVAWDRALNPGLD